jgi:DNA-binding PadR family transcriptional regulator
MQPPLSPTARLLLGMLRLGKRNGYEIKQLVEVSTRFFWTASYGQIYPELGRLEEAGLVASEADPQGGRRRRAYSLTPAGEDALDGWLRAGDELAFEYRAEGLLKLFFSDGLSAEERVELLRAIRAQHQEVVDHLCSIEPGVREKGGGPYLTLRIGRGFNQSMVDLCRDLESELAPELARR